MTENINTSQITVFKIAAAYIGTIVGAGFASGQEVLQFFGLFGIFGLSGVLLTTILFSVYGYTIMKVAKNIKAQSHLPVIKKVSGAKIGYLIDLVITAFLYGAVVTMAAGMGAIFTQEFGLASTFGSSALLLFTMVTVLFGIRGVLSTLSVLVPILMLAVFTISITSLYNNWGIFIANLTWTLPAEAPVPVWFLSAIVYTSYNIVIAVAVLAPLGGLADHKQLKSASILSGIGLGLGAGIITMAILANIPQVLNVEVPMLLIAGQVSPVFRIIYTLALLAGVYTTAVACLYGFAARITNPEDKGFRTIVIGASIMAFFLSRLGFSSLVGILFPAVGYAGLLLIGSLTYVLVKDFKVDIKEKFYFWRLPGVGYKKLFLGNEKHNSENKKDGQEEQK